MRGVKRMALMALPAQRTRNDGPRTTNTSAFTLIEIMVVVGIMAVIFAIGIPSVYQQMRKDTIRQAVKDIAEACMEARKRAILTGRTTEVRIRPLDRTINVIEGASGTESTASSFAFHGDEIVEKPASGGGIYSAKFSDRISIFYAEVNSEVNLQELPEFTCLFRPNGTCDLMGIVLRTETAETWTVFTDEVTGIADWVVGELKK